MDKINYVVEEVQDAAASSAKYIKESVEEIHRECIPTQDIMAGSTWRSWAMQAKGIFHIPYAPAFTRPGWLWILLTSPRDEKMLEGIYGDIFAGFTVGMTAIPQALSYAALAGLPPINGLYAMIMPSVVYIFLGSGMQLAVGPVAIVSLLMGELVTKYGLNAATDPVGCVNFAAQAAFCSGLMMLVAGLLNMGNLIRFISYPVMAGFTTASAMIIGLNQIKNAFGFPKSANVPQVGGEVDYNYEVMRWYMDNWDGRTSSGYLWRNVHAVNITFGIYVPLILLWFFKRNYIFSAETKKTAGYQLFNFIATVSTLMALIIAAHEAYLIHNFNDTYHARALKVVGDVPPGLDIFRTPKFEHDMGKVFVDVIPLTIISYMESYAVARKTSASRGQLSILNASQELVAMGVGNMINSVASGYTVSGSFSRSSLYASCGAVTPLAKSVTLLIILVALGTLTKTFYFIPQAALSAVVMVAIAGLIDFHEFWVAWKLSKKDFFVMIMTFIFTFVYDTEIGLLVGVSTSLAMLLRDLAYSLESKPISRALNFQGIDVIRLNSNLVFVSATTIKDTLINEVSSFRPVFSLFLRVL
jgi:high affinity sulfate transporter 1